MRAPPLRREGPLIFGSSFLCLPGAGSSRDTETMADVARALALPVILVVGMRLGCLNHALLSAQAISAAGVRLAGWIANHVQRDFEHAPANISTLEQRLQAPLLESVAFDASSAAFTSVTALGRLRAA